MEVPHCLRCNSTSYCIECQLGYIVSPTTDLCVQCDLECLVCNVTGYCSQCKIGYYSLLGVCTPCGSNCLACNNTLACFDCATGYILEPATQTCVDCPDECASCNPAAECETCWPGYYYEETSGGSGGGDCILCEDGCETCHYNTTSLVI